jgi:PAT family beta-lactamase induction signal transducer AmpG
MNFIATTRGILRGITGNKRHFIILLLGFSSGLPAALTASTLQAWFTQTGINLQTIGAVTLLVFPYSFRFLWASIFDHYAIPGFDRRRGWLYVTQIGLILAIVAMAFLAPEQTFKFYSWSIPWLMVVGFITAFLSSSQDITIGAYQIEFLPKEEQGLGAAIYGVGWRVSSIISGAVALLLAKYVGWRETYLFMAGLMGIGVIATYLAPNAAYVGTASKTLLQATVIPLKEFFQRYGLKTAFIFILIIITYKAGDALALALNTTFLLRQMGFDLATVGLVNKTVSIFSSILGGLIAGIFITRMSLYRALMMFGLIQGFANLGYALLAYWGKSLFLLVFTAFLENFCSGLGSIALVAMIMTLCNVRFTATHFAVLSAIAFIPRTIVGPISAPMVDALGWTWFFIVCTIVSMPTLLFVYLNKKVILKLKTKEEVDVVDFDNG